MKLNYDPRTDSLMLELAKGKYDRSKKISEDILVDYDARGKILGVEILAAKKMIPAFSPRKTKLVFQQPAAFVN